MSSQGSPGRGSGGLRPGFLRRRWGHQGSAPGGSGVGGARARRLSALPVNLIQGALAVLPLRQEGTGRRLLKRVLWAALPEPSGLRPSQAAFWWHFCIQSTRGHQVSSKSERLPGLTRSLTMNS